MASQEQPITVPEFAAMKAAGRKITMLTAYDYTMARLVDEAGIEGILVGDSLAMVVQGRTNTLPVTLDEVIYHAEMVSRAARHALVVADMPFLTYQLGPSRAIENAGRVLKQTQCRAVKIEGGVEQAEIVAAVVAAGIPVMGHCGLRPQSIQQTGGYRVQRDRQRLVDDVKAIEQAGAFSVVLECIPAALAQEVTSATSLPTIGIGAGAGCDGQILVIHDLLGLTPGHVPRHVRRYADLTPQIAEALRRYRDDVRAGGFPGSDESFT